MARTEVTLAPHWNPEHWKRGDSAMYGEFPATLPRRHVGVRVPGGEVCVSGADLTPRT